MAKIIDIPKDNNIIRIPIEEAMPDNYLPYAVEVAKDRALPDVRDGLKPVHRRILYGSYMLRATPDKPYYKSARIVGDILGKYHPHGDASVYDSMVILAQNFSTRMPLIDGHGNWGSIDGDSAAAMRYTEARLTPIALEMIRDIDKDVVDMVENYSETELEPSVLPSRYPNILVNGAFGIAVGLATNIPPHNLKEVIQALLAYIDNNEITTSELMEYLKGPDLPTGGVLIGKNSLLSAYETGEGKVVLRAKASIETLENGRFGIVITEFPYRKNKAKLLQTISEMTGDKRHAKALEAIVDIRDESDRNGIRAVIELRKSAEFENADKILKYLYKKTDLQSNLNFNVVALANGKPETMGLKTILMYYLNHQKEVITRRTQKELDIALRRFHIIEGFIKAIDIMDQIIEIIRASKSKKEAHSNLMEKFQFSEIQSEAILELMLYRLTGLEIKTFQKEYKELEKQIKKLNKILANEIELLKVIKTEIIEIMEQYGEERKTEIIEDEAEAKIDIDDLLVVEDIVITLSNEGYIKRVPLKNYNRYNSDVNEIELREGDYNRFLLQSNTRDSFILFTDKGNMYQIKGFDIPEYRWKEKGERLDDVIKGINLEEEKIIVAYSIPSFIEDKYFVFITNKGAIKKTMLEKFCTSYSKIMALRLRSNETLIYVALCDDDRKKQFIEFETCSELKFDVEEPELEAVERNILGTQMVNLSEKDEIISVAFKEEFQDIKFTLVISEKGDLAIIDKDDDVLENEFKVNTSTREQILIFNDKGIVFKVTGNMLANMKERINLETIVDDFDRNSDKILKVVSIKDFDEINYVYFFSKKGLIKKTALVEFEGQYISSQAYKFKGENDILMSVVFGRGDGENIIIVTKKAMTIKFTASSVNPMGKIASGVTGISLKEDDEVILGLIVDDESAVTAENNLRLRLISNTKEQKDIDFEDIKLQNRAGRGNSMMLIVLDDYVKIVKII